MKKKRKKIRKSELIGRELEKRANKLFGEPNNSKTTRVLLKSIADKKINEELWEATKKFIKAAHDPNFKPLFS